MRTITAMKEQWQGLKSRLPARDSLPRPKRPALPDLVLTIGTASLVLVCLGLLSVPAVHRLTLRAKAAAVVGNAATVQLAAETFASAHQGRYAEDARDLLPYLPDDTAPANPYTSREIEVLGKPGDLTYRSPSRGGDYVIQAFAMGPGGRPRLVKTLTGRSEH